MSLNNTLWQAAPAQINLSSTVSTIGSITRMSIRNGAEVMVETDPGNIWPGRATLKSIKPTGQLGTKDIAAAITVLGVNGLCFADPDYLDLRANKRVCSGTSASAVHTRYRFVRGLLVPRTLRVSHQEDAELTFDVFGVTPDGSTAPITITQDLAAVVQPASSDRWTLGPTTVGAAAFTCKTQVEFDFGITVRQRGCDSEFWDSAALIEKVEPKVTLTGLNADWAEGDVRGLVDQLGLAATHANSAIYLANRHALPAATEHIRFTVNGLATLDNIIETSGADDGTTSIVISTNYDGTLAPIVPTVGVALP